MAVGDGEQETWQSSETGSFPEVAGNLLSMPNVGECRYQSKWPNPECFQKLLEFAGLEKVKSALSAGAVQPFHPLCSWMGFKEQAMTEKKNQEKFFLPKFFSFLKKIIPTLQNLKRQFSTESLKEK